jgi:hypothetical protein
VIVNANFEEDIKNYVLSKLEINYLNNKLRIYPTNSDLYSLTSEADVDKLLLKYSNWRNRLLLGRKRKVFFSKELYINPFYSSYRNKIYKLKGIFENGSNIRPFLSTQVNNINSFDPLLNAWGMHHLHFISKYQANEKKKRTNEILFIMEDYNNIYFINIFNHKDWVNLNPLKIVKRNWPNSIERYKLKGISATQSLTETEMWNLRKKHANAVLDLDGDFYIQPKGGIVSAGYTISDRVNLDRFFELMSNLLEHIRDNNEIKETITQKLGKNIPELNLTLCIEESSKTLNIVDQKLNINLRFEKELEMARDYLLDLWII